MESPPIQRIASSNENINDQVYPDPLKLLEQIITLLAIEPFSLGGVIIKARHGPTRDKVLDIIEKNLNNFLIQKVYPGISEIHLDGGLDFASTLEQRRPVYTRGLFDGKPKFIKLVMGERIDPNVAAKFSQRMDLGQDFSLIILDEGINDDEKTPSSLTDRISFFLNLDQIGFSKLRQFQINKKKIANAKVALLKMKVPENFYLDVTNLSVSLGIMSMRPPFFTIKVATILAAARGSDKVEEEDILDSITLTLSHRAKFLPNIQEDNLDQDKSQQDDLGDDQKNTSKEEEIPLELLIEAAKANLPLSVLESIGKENKSSENFQINKSGSGQKKFSFLRGRPLPSRQGIPNGRNRIDIIGTLRTAAPWQQLRKNSLPEIQGNQFVKNKIEFKSGDIKIRRYQDFKHRLIIFAVDASGSLAVGRLAEAKGAVELLLAKAYSSRDQVALIAFRGEAAETLLTPSKSLTKTKRALSSLPGGGGTPLASGLEITLKLALDYRHKGFSPIAVILTDGKANITIEGNKGREKALEDSVQMAKLFPVNEIKSIVIDTSNRMQPSAQDLSKNLGGEYLTLPRANAHQLSDAVMSKLD